jgi:hypothetical protein
MTVEELHSVFIKHELEFTDHRARMQTEMREARADFSQHQQDMTAALNGLRRHGKETADRLEASISRLGDRIPMNGWRAKAAVGGGTGVALVALHLVAKMLGYDL